MSLEGRIDIDLLRHDGQLTAVEIRSSRPQLAQKLLAGRTPDDAVQLAGMIFSLCGQAQSLAARAACDAAQGLGTSSPAQAVLIELGLEHSWRLLLNWPQQLGLPPDQASLLALRQAPPAQLAERLDQLLTEVMLGEPAEVWLQRDLAGFDAWRGAGSTPLAQCFATLGAGIDHGISAQPWLPTLGELGNDDLRALAEESLANISFCAQPSWHGQPAETGALARVREQALLAAWLEQRGRGNGARLLARLVELAQLPMRLRQPGSEVARAWRLAQDCGAAGVETSRGLLLHVVRLAGKQIADYRILAPTEWNFHPQGPLHAALLDLPADDRLEEQARQTVLALDPCVDYGLEIIDG